MTKLPKNASAVDLDSAFNDKDYDTRAMTQHTIKEQLIEQILSGSITEASASFNTLVLVNIVEKINNSKEDILRNLFSKNKLNENIEDDQAEICDDFETHSDKLEHSHPKLHKTLQNHFDRMNKSWMKAYDKDDDEQADGALSDMQDHVNHTRHFAENKHKADKAEAGLNSNRNHNIYQHLYNRINIK